jgi:hypothetical protein
VTRTNPYLLGVDILGGVAHAYVDVDEAEVIDTPVVIPQHLTSVPNTDGGRTVDGGGPPGKFPGGRALVPFATEDRPPALVGRSLKSELEGVSDEAWTKFALAMKTAEPGTVSKSNAYGMFAIKPRRLADLGLIKNVTNVNTSREVGGQMLWVGEWVPGDGAVPLTEEVFLKNPKLQYRAFVASMKRYVQGLRDGSIVKPDGGHPKGMTLSGILAILHKCGPKGLKTWNTSERFETTTQLFEAANGIF